MRRKVFCMVNYKAIGQRIRAERKKLNLTQEVLAEKLSISLEHLSRIETGVCHPSIRLIQVFSEFFQVDEAYLMFGCARQDDIDAYIIEKIAGLPDRKKDAIYSIIDIIAAL